MTAGADGASGRRPCHNAGVVLLISTYDLGRQPFGLASAAAALRAAGAEVVCADLAKERLSDAAVRRATAVAFFLPMHTATRLAVPVIDRVRARQPGRDDWPPTASTRRSTPRCCASTACRSILGGEFEDDAGRGVVGEHRPIVDAAPGGASDAPRVPRVQFLVPDRAGPAGADDATRRSSAGAERTDGRLHRGQPRLQAPLPALSDRPGLRRPLPRRPGRHRAGRRRGAGRRRRAGTSPSAIPTSSTASATRVAVVERFAGEFPGVTYDVTIKVEHLLAARRRAAAAARHRLRVRDDRGRSRRRSHARARSRRGTRAPTSSAWSSGAATRSASRSRRRSWRSRRGRRSRAIAICCRRSTGSISSSTSRRSSSRSGCSSRKDRGCWSSPDVRAVIAAVQPALADLSVGPRRSARRRVAEARSKRWSACNLSAPRRELFARVWALAHDAAGLAAERYARARHPGAGGRSRISTNPGTVERSPRRSRWL